MKCNKCGYEINDSWTFCPNCSNRLHKGKDMIIIGIVAVMAILYFGFFKSNSMFSISKFLNIDHVKNEFKDPKFASDILEKKYNEKFDVSFVEAHKNPDGYNTIFCDGVVQTTPKKGKGYSYNYKAHSIKNNLTFLVTYNDQDTDYTIYDSYDVILESRDSFLDAYKIVNDSFNDFNNSVVIYNEDTTINVDSESDIINAFNDNYEKTYKYYFDGLKMSINENAYDFCNENYELLSDVNYRLYDAIWISNDGGFDFYIEFNNGEKIELGSGTNIDYVTSEGPHIPLTDFLEKESLIGE